MNDDLHPNGAGHAEMANAVFLAMASMTPESNLQVGPARQPLRCPKLR